MKPLPEIDEKRMRASAKAHPKDTLANDEPVVLESSESDPEFPAMEEYEVDEDGPKGAKGKHPGLIWAIIAVLAVIVLCFALARSGDWMNPQEAQQVQDAQENEQIVPEDMGR